MADFKAHTSVGTQVGIVSLARGFCSLIGSIVILFLVATSSATPDIDSDTGSPRELLLSLLGTAIPIVLLFNISESTSSENILAATLISFFLTRYLQGHLLKKFTVHHSLPGIGYRTQFWNGIKIFRTIKNPNDIILFFDFLFSCRLHPRLR